MLEKQVNLLNENAKMMTLKKIATLCGYKTHRTLLKWIRENNVNFINKNVNIFNVIKTKIDNAQKTKKQALFTLEEVIFIVELKNPALASILRTNVNLPAVKELSTNNYVTKGDFLNLLTETIPLTVEKTVKTTIEQIFPLIQNKSPVPEIDIHLSPRKELTYKVNVYARLTGLTQQEIYCMIYSYLSAHKGFNVALKAKKMELKIIDFIDTYDSKNNENLLNTCVKIINKFIREHKSATKRKRLTREEREEQKLLAL